MRLLPCPILFFLLFWAPLSGISQERIDSARQASSEKRVAEDPSQLISRLEIQNELQEYNSGMYLNMSTFRAVIKFAERFTTRIEIPFVYNSKSANEYKQQGISDLSFRVLGFRIYESKRDAITLSLEASLNTAASPLLGTGKNILLFMGTYTRMLVPKRSLLAGAIQQANSISGDQTRARISYTKLQAVLIQFWSKKTWSAVSPEVFLDYIQGGISMNLEGRLAYAPAPKFNLWVKAGCGVFGNFIARYQWTSELGARVFL